MLIADRQLIYLGNDKVYSLFDEEDGQESLTFNNTACFLPPLPGEQRKEGATAFVVNGTLMSCGELCCTSSTQFWTGNISLLKAFKISLIFTLKFLSNCFLAQLNSFRYCIFV